MKRFLKSFYYAWNGILAAFREQVNLKVHAMAVIVVVTAGCYFGLTAGEWTGIVLAIGVVLVAELFNTAIESIVDMISPERHPLAGKIKDIAAGAVLAAAITAIIVAFLTFEKHIF